MESEFDEKLTTTTIKGNSTLFDFFFNFFKNEGNKRKFSSSDVCIP